MVERQKRPLSGLGGKIQLTGERVLAEKLRHALDVAGEEALGELTHGFHSYPARFHPLLVRRLLATFAGRRVLDPFVGSGTTLVETTLAGRTGLGVDLNPLAVLLSGLKATVWDDTARVALAQAVAAVVARSTEATRRRSRQLPMRTRYDDPRRYPPHIFRELCGLRAAIDTQPVPQRIRDALLLLLSSIVVKVSLQRSDTDETLVHRNVPRGAATRHFAAKAVELDRRLAQLTHRTPPGTPSPDVRLGDARRLEHLGDRSIDLVITSPPYLGTYDYARHHLRRFGWLGLDPTPLVEREIGARRHGGRAAWQRDVAACLGEMARVLSPGGLVLVLTGDSASQGVAIDGRDAIAQGLEGTPLHLVASASQARPVAFRDQRHGRQEHLLALVKT